MAANSTAGAFTAQEFIDGTLACIISWGVCVGVRVRFARTLGKVIFIYFFIFLSSAVFGDVSFPTAMHEMFGLPALIIPQNNGTRLAAVIYAARAPARCVRNWLLLFLARRRR